MRRAIGTSDFDAQMSGLKFWKGDENLRPVNKIKQFYGILTDGLFLDFFVHRKYTLTLLLDENFLGRMECQRIRLFILSSKMFI
jgi:hypothetical protein